LTFVPVTVPAAPAAPQAVPVLSLRSFKIADHESPLPLDRAYVGFNFYNEVGGSVGSQVGSPVRNQRVYLETFAFEKTCLDGTASVGMRLPLNTLTGQSDVPGLGGATTDVGDLSVILKYAAWHDACSGNLISVGLAVTTPTGPNGFAGSAQAAPFHETTLQPYVGYIFHGGDFFLHGFTAIDVPTDARDVTILYNDIGVGYYLPCARGQDRLLTAVVPTVEVHVNTPLDHRGTLLSADLAATPDVIDLTAGTQFFFCDHALLGVGVVAPVTGPRPFDVEAIAHFELRF
jgi:hypothetical protein